MRSHPAAIALALVTVLLIGGAEVSAVDVYVAPGGADTNAGTAAAPLRTFEAARDRVRQLHPADGATIWVGGGTYVRDHALELTKDDSGSAGGLIVWRTHEGDAARIVMARPMKASELGPVTDPAVLSRLSPAARGHVVTADLRAMRVKGIHRWPDEFAAGSQGTIQLLYRGQRMRTARWPNDGPTTMKSVVDGEKGVFVAREDRMAHWPLDRGVWLEGYWRVPWVVRGVRVAGFDPATHEVTLAAKVPGGLGSKYAKAGHGSGKEPYWVVNQLEELDQLGEWCLDFGAGRLYFWAPGPIGDGDVIVSDRHTPAITMKDVSNVKIEGLSFVGGLGDAIQIDGGEGVKIVRCTIDGFAKDGIVIRRGRRHAVERCEVEQMGGRGISVQGGDRATLTPCGDEVVSNHIHDFGQVKPVYSPAVLITSDSVGVRVAHNLVHDAPHVGILYGGNNNTLEYNEIYRVCLDTDDMGAFYTWHDWTSWGNVVRYNYIHDSPRVNGIYCDDGDSGDEIYGNVLQNLSIGVFVGGGHHNIATGNIVIHCQRGLHVDARGVKRGYNLQNKSMVDRVRSVHPEREPWAGAFPELKKVLTFHPELPTGTVFESNLLVDCPKPIDRGGRPEQLEYTTFRDNEAVTGDPGWLDPKHPEKGLKPGAAVLKKLPKLRARPPEAIGLLP